MPDALSVGLGVGVLCGVPLLFVCCAVCAYVFKPHMLLRVATRLQRWSARTKSRRVTAGGFNWHYLEVNSEAPNVLLMLHGFNGTCDDAVHVAAALRKLKLHSLWRIISPDLPAHGATVPQGARVCNRAEGEYDASELDGDYGADASAHAVAAFIRGLGFGPVHVIGFSRGGMIAGVLADRFPELVASLTLVNPAGVEAPEPSAFQLSLSGGETPRRPYKFPSEAEVEAAGLPMWLLPRTGEEAKLMFDKLACRAPLRIPRRLLDAFAQHCLRRRKLMWRVAEAMSPTALEECAPRIRAPTLLVTGLNDEYVSASCTPVLERLLRAGGAHKRTLLLENCGHAVYVEGSAVLEAVSAFAALGAGVVGGAAKAALDSAAADEHAVLTDGHVKTPLLEGGSAGSAPMRL
jgi:pimeloyl-ACP methyl ester carboxylesterase